MWFIYNINGSAKVVDNDEHREKLNSGEWFSTPNEAKAALMSDISLEVSSGRGSIPKDVELKPKKAKKNV